MIALKCAMIVYDYTGDAMIVNDLSKMRYDCL